MRWTVWRSTNRDEYLACFDPLFNDVASYFALDDQRIRTRETTAAYANRNPVAGKLMFEHRDFVVERLFMRAAYFLPM